MTDLLEEFLSRDLGIETIKTYRYELEKFERFLKEHESTIYQLKPELLYLYTKGYENTTRNKKVSIVKNYYEWVTGEKFDVKTLKQRNFVPERKLELSEVQKMIEYTSNKRDKLIMKTLFVTGIRISELVRMKKSDIKRINGKVYFKFIAKGNKERNIILQEDICRELLGFKSAQNSLFGIGKRQVEKIIARISNEALGKTVTPHMFRHGFATELMNQKVSFSKIQEVLGHELIATTLKYIHNERNDDSWNIQLKI